MKAILLGREEHQSPEWYALRSNGIGGSEIAAVVGLSPWTSRFALWHRKRGLLEEQQADQAMSWGTRLEPIICEAFTEAHPEFWVQEAGTYRHAERTWQLANVDRMLYPTENVGVDTDPLGLLEVKTASAFDAFEWGKPGTDEIPPYYRCQVLWYLDVLGLPSAHLAVLIGGSDYREYVIDYAADEAEWLREEGAKFWAEVQAGIPPAIDEHSATYEAVRAMHPDINGEDIEIPSDIYHGYATTKTAAEEATAAHRKAKATLLDAMGNARRALVEGTPVLRRQAANGRGIALHPIKQKKEAAA